jgi:hypothetical protein
MMCGPTWNSLPFPIACDFLVTHLPTYTEAMPTLRKSARITAGIAGVRVVEAPP